MINLFFEKTGAINLARVSVSKIAGDFQNVLLKKSLLMCVWANIRLSSCLWLGLCRSLP